MQRTNKHNATKVTSVAHPDETTTVMTTNRAKALSGARKWYGWKRGTKVTFKLVTINLWA